MTRFVAALLLAVFASFAGGVSPDPKDLAIPPQELSKARELIKRLGSEIYREREEAHAELAKMGRLARPALVEAAASDADPEVRYRCSRLLPKAGADDLKARLDTFLADTESKYEHDLAGTEAVPQARRHGREGPRALRRGRQVAVQRRTASGDRQERDRGRPGNFRSPHASVEPDPATLRPRPAARSAAPDRTAGHRDPAVRRVDHAGEGDPADGDLELRHRCELPPAELGDAGAQRQQQRRACRSVQEDRRRNGWSRATTRTT